MSSTIEEIPKDNIDHESSSSDNEEMPALEDIANEMSKLPENNKNIKGLPGDSDEESLEAEENGWIDILSNGDLRMKCLKQSSKPEPVRPQPGNKCRIRIITRLYDQNISSENDDGAKGDIIDAECDDDKAIVVGDADIHQSIDLMLPLMNDGQTCRLIIKPRFAYGPIGNIETGIPANTTLDIELELLEIVDFELPPNDENGDNSGDSNPVVFYEPLSERFILGETKKRRGNFWYQRGEFSLAIQCYRGAVKYLDVSREELKIIEEYKNGPMSGDMPDVVREDYLQVEAIIQERSQTYNNLAAAQLKMQAFDSALRSVEECLNLAPKNVKALFRRAKILVEKGDIEKAIGDLRLASELDPQSEAIEFELQRLNSKLARQNQEQRAMYRRMMKMDEEQQQKDNDSDSKNDKNSSTDVVNDKTSGDKSSNNDGSKCSTQNSSTNCGILKGSCFLSSNIFTKGITVLAIVVVCFAVGIPLFNNYFK